MSLNKDKSIAVLLNSLAAGGAERMVLNVLQEWMKRGYSFQLLLLEDKKDYPIPDGIKITQIGNLKGNEIGPIKFFSLFIYSLRLKHWIQENKIHFVQSHLSRVNYINVLAKLLGGGHYVQIVVHTVLGENYKKGINGTVNRFLIRLLYPLADEIIVNSEGLRDFLVNMFPSLKGKINIIYNSFPVDDIRRRGEIEKFSGASLFKKQKIYIIYVGRLIKSKRIIDLLKAFQILVKEFYPADLIILGDGEEKNELKRFTQKANIGHRVFFLGFVDNPYPYLNQSDIFVLPSEFESFGNVLIEAMINRCAVIAANCNYGPKEILDLKKRANKDGIAFTRYGVLYPVGDYLKLAKVLKKMIEVERLRSYYQQISPVRAKDFAADAIASKYLTNL